MLFRDEWLSTVEDAHRAFVFPNMRADLAAHVSSGKWLAAAVSIGSRPLGLAVVSRHPERPVLLSIFVGKPWRRIGVGRRLLRRVISATDRPLQITYRSDLASLPALTALLNQEDFATPYLTSVCFEYRIADVDFDQIGRWRWRKGLSVIEWGALSPAQRDHLNADWVPKGLNPRLTEEGCDPVLSLALLHGEDLVGWLIFHRLPGDLFRCTTGYVQPLRLASGGFSFLCAELLRRQKSAYPDSRTIWTVAAGLPAFIAFLHRRMQPAGGTITEFHRRLREPSAAPADN